MRIAHYLRNPRIPKTPLVLLFLVSLACTQLPLFNYLGFEFSALTAIVAGFLAGLATISLWKKFPSEREEDQHAAGTPSADEQSWRFLKSLSLYLAVVCLLPAAIMSMNALLVKNCSFSQGLLFYGLLVVPGVIFCSMLALFLTVSPFHWKRTWFVIFFLLLIGHIVYVTFTRPQIFAFNPIVGFFPGITYDETMQIEGRLVLYRWATVSASLLLFIGAVVMNRWNERTKRPLNDAPRAKGKLVHGAELAGVFVLVAIVAGIYLMSEKLGLASTQASVEERLGGRIETKHFVILYPANFVDEGRARQLAQLHEFYFAKLVQELRVVSVKKIHSFLYASPDQKGRLIGAGRTNIAKPWLWQLHLNLGDVETSLKHELVHVLAADFGFPLVRVGLNPGLIEGLATAVERVQYEESTHRVAAQILSVGIYPNMERLFSFSGFAGTYPGVSYSLAGSFCRFLIDQYGIRRFKRLYRSGDFRSAYNRDLAVLLAEWRAHLERYRVDESERRKAEYRFKRASIFARECARVIANINAETRQYAARGEYQRALESANRSLELSTSPEAVSQVMNALMRLDRYNEAIAFAEEYLNDSTLAHTLLPMKLQVGDSYWAIGNAQRARETYEDVLAAHMSIATDEACALRLEALGDADVAQRLQPYFVGLQTDTARIATLQASLRSQSHRELKTYLLAREYAAKGNDRLAVELLNSIPSMGVYLLEFQRQLRLARMQYSLGEFQKAKISFWQSMNYTNSEPLLFRIQEWIDRCDWMTHPPFPIFELLDGELQSHWEGDNPCDCTPNTASFLPVLPN